MSVVSRRQFVGGAASVAALPAASGAPAFRPPSHPLEGIAREDLKITDIKVPIMSYELKDKSWITATQLIWKSDAVLVEVFTDKGIAGIGESSPYGGRGGPNKHT